MAIRFYTLLDDGKLLPFRFDAAAAGRVILEDPISLEIDSSDGPPISLSADLVNERLYVVAANAAADWVSVHELKLDGTSIRRDVLRSARAGVTASGDLGALVTAGSGEFLWHANVPLLLPLAPQDSRSERVTAQPGYWWADQNTFLRGNAEGSLVLYSAASGMFLDLSLERFDIDPLRTEDGENRELAIASIERHGDALTIAWSSRFPIPGGTPEFHTIVRRYPATKLLAAARREEDLPSPIIDHSLDDLRGQISGACYRPPAAADKPEELFMAGFPKGRFRRFERKPEPDSLAPRPPWELTDDLNLSDKLAEQITPSTTENARFLQLGPQD
jgi:hypothetical protein